VEAVILQPLGNINSLDSCGGLEGADVDDELVGTEAWKKKRKNKGERK